MFLHGTKNTILRVPSGLGALPTVINALNYSLPNWITVVLPLEDLTLDSFLVILTIQYIACSEDGMKIGWFESLSKTEEFKMQLNCAKNLTLFLVKN